MKLSEFLKKKKVITAFKRNVVNYGNSYKYPSVENLTNETIDNEIEDITNSFLWKCTPEGYDYWNKLHEEYIANAT